MSALSLILLSLAGYTLVYAALRSFALEWLLHWCLGDKLKVQASSDDSRTTVENKAGVVCVTDGDLAKITNLSISILMAILTAVVSVLIVWETSGDVLHSQSFLVLPYTHFSMWYFVADTFTYYKVFVLRKNTGHLPLLKRLLLFVKLERAIIIHHFLIFFIGYPIACDYRSVRHGLGDFFIGTFMVQEFSNPFQHLAIILRMLKQQQSKLYFWNGLILIPVYFVVRILNIPLAFLTFAAQIHNWDILTALRSMFFICHAFNMVQLSLQLVWFSAIIRIAMRAGMLRAPWSRPTSTPNTSSHSKVD